MKKKMCTYRDIERIGKSNRGRADDDSADHSSIFVSQGSKRLFPNLLFEPGSLPFFSKCIYFLFMIFTNKQSNVNLHRPDTSSRLAQASSDRASSLGLPSSSYSCTLCGKENVKPAIAFGIEGRIVCKACWKWIYNVSICWRCGEVVYRKTDSVSFGWC